jgi:copper chaperone
MGISIEVENIKCNGCATSIRHKLAEDARVGDVAVDIEAGRVDIEADEDARADLIATLLHMGYPEKGSVEGLQAAASKAKSFVSCAIGRFENATQGESD